MRLRRCHRHKRLFSKDFQKLRNVDHQEDVLERVQNGRRKRDVLQCRVEVCLDSFHQTFKWDDYRLDLVDSPKVDKPKIN